jgi:hypothetical protein
MPTFVAPATANAAHGAAAMIDRDAIRLPGML